MNCYREEAVNLIKLGTPVFVASVAQTGMGFVDTIMAGGVSAIDMAAVSIAASIWLPSILFGVGLLMALVPIVAQLNGSGRRVKIPFEVQQGMTLALLISVPIIIVLLQTPKILKLMEVEALMTTKTLGYIHAVIFAVPAFLLSQTLRSFTDGLSMTKPAMFIGFIGLVLNIPLNWIFVYGKLGAPALGGIGCGVATTIVYWIMFILLVIYVTLSPRLHNIRLFREFHKPQLKAQLRLFKLGFPVATAIFFEVTLFAVVSLLISPLGSLIVAAHQVAINFSSVIFMLPMSIGAAVSIRVGYRLGEGNTTAAKISSRVGILLGLAFSIITALMTVIYRENIALLYTQNTQVVELAITLLVFAAIYQCADSIQVIAAGALRGYKDMRAIFYCTFVAYWLLGLPVGFVLARTDWLTEPLGAQGFWLGFIIGLTVAAILLGLRLHWIHNQPSEKQLKFAQQ
ncbi:MATE family efflux transporter [Vibrio sagamiensis]|uniref:Multidrug resistance protein NorM n=1 Tax=Vibrio sagamiensis NBRC 104589 TaxID=1219064 RepID=A0A511QDN1_9VIBR|nr:MATE family efflux transporter [Vibrio sagamiensis]PNQ54252.1 MATE family efflux transporter [Vibrio agarivorans]GEM75421.1 multidrug resistance protein NorM [Vibrio sagamiensis NBRC 104589]